jgi:hypothetical protein
MQAQLWGIKTFYYSLINKQGSKATEELQPELQVNGVQLNGYHQEEIEDDCEACKL